ncbi:hypothetical protein E2C01_024800 [Portunus trituberculatus]|uniref:Uncharacterized protein n=1 Tax=Portunus trituberculatus TaxID=210409 RepID=A0A5B7EDD3_PORTR|nr:hypothetical protein [Portunus trituberculatus]
MINIENMYTDKLSSEDCDLSCYWPENKPREEVGVCNPRDITEGFTLPHLSSHIIASPTLVLHKAQDNIDTPDPT